MKIKMLQTVNGKVNGIKMGPYSEGAEYDLDAERAQLFIGSAMAEPVIQYTPISEITNTGDTGEAIPVSNEGLIRRIRRSLPTE